MEPLEIVAVGVRRDDLERKERTGHRGTQPVAGKGWIGRGGPALETWRLERGAAAAVRMSRESGTGRGGRGYSVQVQGMADCGTVDEGVYYCTAIAEVAARELFC